MNRGCRDAGAAATINDLMGTVDYPGWHTLFGILDAACAQHMSDNDGAG